MIVVEYVDTASKIVQIVAQIVIANVLTPSAQSSAIKHVAYVPSYVLGSVLRTTKIATNAIFYVQKYVKDYRATFHAQKSYHAVILAQVFAGNLVQIRIVDASNAPFLSKR